MTFKDSLFSTQLEIHQNNDLSTKFIKMATFQRTVNSLSLIYDMDFRIDTSIFHKASCFTAKYFIGEGRHVIRMTL